MSKKKIIIGLPWDDPSNDILNYLTFEEAQLVVDKGHILFCLRSGTHMKIKANSLGDGIKRLVSYFKDMKKILSKNYAQAELIQEFMRSDILKILEKHEIDLEAL